MNRKETTQRETSRDRAVPDCISEGCNHYIFGGEDDLSDQIAALPDGVRERYLSGRSGPDKGSES